MRENDFWEPGTTNTVTLPETNISHPENGWFPRRSFPILGPVVTFQGGAVKLQVGGGIYLLNFNWREGGVVSYWSFVSLKPR